MKKYPYVFLGIFISILVFFVIHIISITIKMNRVINVKDFDSISDKLTEMDVSIQSIKNEDCKASLNAMANRIVNTIPQDGITLKQYYEMYYVNNNGEEETFLHYYSRVSDACEIDNDSIYLKALESLEFPYEIKNRYMGAYQVNFNDMFILNKEIDKTDELGSYSTKMLELETLSRLISETAKYRVVTEYKNEKGL